MGFSANTVVAPFFNSDFMYVLTCKVNDFFGRGNISYKCLNEYYRLIIIIIITNVIIIIIMNII